MSLLFVRVQGVPYFRVCCERLGEGCSSKRLRMENSGGEGGIRTPGTLSGTPVFKTGAINHSATSPATATVCNLDAANRGLTNAPITIVSSLHEDFSSVPLCGDCFVV